jgi:two-component system chemotaxis response regulator CheY
MKILLVDDSAAMRAIQKEVLAALGEVTFTECGNGEEAWKLASAEAFDLIILDTNMPGMDGMTLVSKIREKDKRVPLVMVTTEAERSRVILAIRSGVNQYVVKPFTPALLLEKVKTTLEKLKAVA